MVSFLPIRLSTMIFIGTGTALICCQDFMKKAMVMKKVSGKIMKNKNKNQKQPTMQQKFTNRYEETKQLLKQVKDVGNGSIYYGLKKLYESDNENQTIKDKQSANTYDTKQIIKQPKIENNTQKLSNFKDKIKKYKQRKQKQNQPTSLQISNSQLENQTGILQNPPTITSTIYQRFINTKDNIRKRFNQTFDIYNKALQAKSQKLIKKHIEFGVLTMLGSIVLPRAYLVLSLCYFAAYQIYYFSDIINQNNNYPFLQNIQFTPIWKTFIFAGITFFGLKGIKLIRSLP